MKNTEKTCKKTCGRLKMAADGKPEAQANIKDEKVRTQKRASAAKNKSMRQTGGAGGALAGAAAVSASEVMKFLCYPYVLALFLTGSILLAGRRKSADAIQP